MASSNEETRDRADRLLVRLGKFESRASARAAIEAGQVQVDGVILSKPSQLIAADAEIKAARAHPYVSRGGLKLAHALDVFAVSVAGRECLDIGASTGGFTDVLLRRGAAHITAVDVGQGQLHASLAQDHRVLSLEGFDARKLTMAEFLSGQPTLIVCDASFIALEKLLREPLMLMDEGVELVGLFKPQFQVGRKAVGKGGVVTDLASVDRAQNIFEGWLTEQGWRLLGWTHSPIQGGAGNSESLFHAVKVTQT